MQNPHYRCAGGLSKCSIKFLKRCKALKEIKWLLFVAYDFLHNNF